MELCEHGDAEVFIKAQENGLLPTVEAQGFLFQMAFALYAGRAELSLRHFDVKLLNFFVSDASRLLRAGEVAGPDGGAGGGGGGVTLRYGVGEDVVELCLPKGRAYLVREREREREREKRCDTYTVDNTLERKGGGSGAKQGDEALGCMYTFVPHTRARSLVRACFIFVILPQLVRQPSVPAYAKGLHSDIVVAAPATQHMPDKMWNILLQVKLADFGTADVDPLTVGNPVEACHFSTLENTPIEQLCCGNQARQVQRRFRGVVVGGRGGGVTFWRFHLPWSDRGSLSRPA